jgi:hypothetical protein
MIFFFIIHRVSYAIKRHRSYCITVTGYKVSKLLGIPKAATGKGEEQAKIVYELLVEWNLVYYVKCMSLIQPPRIQESTRAPV